MKSKLDSRRSRGHVCCLLANDVLSSRAEDDVLFHSYPLQNTFHASLILVFQSIQFVVWLHLCLSLFLSDRLFVCLAICSSIPRHLYVGRSCVCSSGCIAECMCASV